MTEDQLVERVANVIERSMFGSHVCKSLSLIAFGIWPR